jgi:hypothetical protein
MVTAAGIPDTACVVIERRITVSRIAAPRSVTKERSKTRRRIGAAAVIMIERLKAEPCVVDAAGKTDEHPAAIGCVSVG